MVTCFSIIEQRGVERDLKDHPVSSEPSEAPALPATGKEETFELKGGWGVRLAV